MIEEISRTYLIINKNLQHLHEEAKELRENMAEKGFGYRKMTGANRDFISGTFSAEITFDGGSNVSYQGQLMRTLEKK